MPQLRRWPRQADDRRAEMRLRIVPELDHLRMTIERSLDDAALNAAAAAVNHPHLVEARRRGGVDVLGHHRRDVARRERVQIDLAFDWNLDRIRVHGSEAAAKKCRTAVSRARRSPASIRR